MNDLRDSPPTIRRGPADASTQGSVPEPTFGAENAPPIQSGSTSRRKLRLYTFGIPSPLAGRNDDPTVIVLRELSGDEQIDASRISGGDRLKTVYESSKMCLHSVDGRLIKLGEGDHEALWSKWSPKMRALVVSGYHSIHNPPPEMDDLFLASMRES